jgi:hypothetical protein
VCRANNHHIGICSLVKRCGFTVTYDAAHDSRSAKPQARRSGTGRPPDRPSTPALPPAPAPSPAPAPARQSTPSAAPSESASGHKADAPSIPSSKGSDSSDSDDDEFLAWHSTNDTAITNIERHRARQAQATQARTNIEPPPSSKVSFARQARPAHSVHNKDARLTRRVAALATAPSTDAWIPDKLLKARSSKTTNDAVESYICVDSGASRDLFPDRSYFSDYKDISDKGHYVVVADNSRIPIQGIGTVRCSLAGHEVLFRKVYHVPALNAPLFSIRTHRRRGPGCSLVADHTGSWLTFPGFILDVDDTDDFLLPIRPSNPDAPLAYAEPVSLRSHLKTARRAAAIQAITCRRSRVPSALQHLLPATPVPGSKPTDEELPIIPTHYVPDSATRSVHRHTSLDLHRLFGCRKLKYDVLPHLGTGLHVSDPKEAPMSIGDTVTMKRGRKGGPVARPLRARHTIGVDIGFGDGTSPGGYNYCLFMVDLATRHTWTYGLSDLTGDSITDALW